MNILTQNLSPKALVKQIIDLTTESYVGDVVNKLRQDRDSGEISTGEFYLAVHELASYIHGNSVGVGGNRFWGQIKSMSEELHDALYNRDRETEALMESAYESLYGKPCLLFKDETELPEAA